MYRRENQKQKYAADMLVAPKKNEMIPDTVASAIRVKNQNVLQNRKIMNDIKK